MKTNWDLEKVPADLVGCLTTKNGMEVGVAKSAISSSFFFFTFAFLMFPSAWLLKKLSLTVGIFTPKDGAVNAEHGLLFLYARLGASFPKTFKRIT